MTDQDETVQQPADEAAQEESFAARDRADQQDHDAAAAPAEELVMAEAEASVELDTDAGEGAHTVNLAKKDDEVVGSIAPAPEPEAVQESPVPEAPPAPFEVDAPHHLDSIDHGTVVTKTTDDGYSVKSASGYSFTDGNAFLADDVLALLPVGTVIEKNEGGQVLLTVPQNERRGPLLTFGVGLHQAVSQVWPWLAQDFAPDAP